MIGKSTRVLAFGYYGAGNAGDEMLLEALAAGVRDNGGSLEAISLDADYTSRRHGIQATDFQDYPGIVRALERSDLFVLGGGGLLQSHYPFSRTALFSFFHMDISAYVRPLLVARQMGVRTLAWAQGIGPLNNPQARDLAAEVVQLIDDRSVRDHSSLDLLRSAGVEGDILVAPDPVWAMPVPEAKLGAVPGQQRIGIVIRPWSFDEAWKDQLVAAIKKTLDRETELVWIPFQTHQIPNRSASDWPLVEELIARLPDWRHVRSEARTTQEIVNAFAECDGLIAMRYHAQIIGARLGKPVVGIEYDDKMSANAEEIGFAADSRVKLSDGEEAWSRAMEWLKRAMRQGTDRLILEKARLVGKQAQAHNHLLAISMKRASSSGHNARPLHEMDWLSHWEIEQLRAQLNARDYQISQMVSGLTGQAELQEALTGSANVLSDSLRRLQAELDASKESLVQRASEAEALKAEIVNSAAMHSALIEAKDQEKSELEEVIRLAKIELETSRTKAEDQAEDIARLNENLSDLERARQDEMEKRALEVNALTQGYEQQLQALGSLMNKIRQENGEVRSEIDEIKKQYEMVFAEKSRIQAVAVEKEARLDKAISEIEKQRAEIDSLWDRIELYREKMVDLNNWGVQQSRQAAMLANEVHELRNSTSWRLTRPLRFVRMFVRSPVNACAEARAYLKRGSTARLSGPAVEGGVIPSVPYQDLPRRQVQRTNVSSDDLSWEEFNSRVLSRRREFKGVFIQEPVIDWNVPLYQRPQHMASALGRAGFLVVYKTVNWSHDDVNGFRQVAPNVWVTNSREIDAVENTVRSVYSTAYALAMEDLSKRPDSTLFVYEYIDHIDPQISGDPENIRRLLSQKEWAFNGGADLLVASANVLMDEVSASVGSERVVLVQNGVDTSHYRNSEQAAVEVPRALMEFRARYPKIVGYFGAIAPWLWYDALNELVDLRPDLGFVFIGPDYYGGVERLPVRDNVLYLGPVDYKVLPGHARLFDVCLIPFEPGEIARTTSPLKLFEYFALEKPVVVTDMMLECIQYPEVFRGGNASELSLAIDTAISKINDIAFRGRLAELADMNDWDRRASTFAQAVRLTMEKRA